MLKFDVELIGMKIVCFFSSWSRIYCLRKLRGLLENCVNFNVRYMLFLIDKCFMVVLLDKMIILVCDESVMLRFLLNEKDDNGIERFVFGFKDLENSGDEGDLKFVVVVYNVFRDVNVLNGEKGDLYIVLVFLRESESRIYCGVVVLIEIGDV